jgi:hypothetical protein
MKKFLIILLAIPILLATLATPVFADETVFSTDLNVGRKAAIDVGDFIVTLGEDNGDTTITFTYLIDEENTDWRLDETHLYIGNEPPTKSAPGRFPYKSENLGGALSNEYTFYLDDIYGGEGTLYVAAHAGLVMEIGQDPVTGDPIYAYETTWAQGDYPIGKGANWATYFELLDLTPPSPE